MHKWQKPDSIKLQRQRRYITYTSDNFKGRILRSDCLQVLTCCQESASYLSNQLSLLLDHIHANSHQGAILLSWVYTWPAQQLYYSLVSAKIEKLSLFDLKGLAFVNSHLLNHSFWPRGTLCPHWQTRVYVPQDRVCRIYSTVTTWTRSGEGEETIRVTFPEESMFKQAQSKNFYSGKGTLKCIPRLGILENYLTSSDHSIGRVLSSAQHPYPTLLKPLKNAEKLLWDTQVLLTF